MLQPGIEANRCSSGVESLLGKDLFTLTSGAIKNPHGMNHLLYFLPFLFKIQANTKFCFGSLKMLYWLAANAKML